MAQPFVPSEFDIPVEFQGPGFHLEPLGPKHNERDHEAWMSSIEHIKSTPGFEGPGWPVPQSPGDNLSDLRMHAQHFASREGFTYSILDGEEVIGCVYVYPSATSGTDAEVRSWVRVSRAEMDMVVWRTLSRWLDEDWPFENPSYAARA